MRTAGLFAVLAALRLGFAPLAAQDATAYVPLRHWTMAYVEHLITRGAMADPAPLTRPLREADVVGALLNMDSAAVSPGDWRASRRVLARLARRQRGPWVRIDADLSLTGATHALRDPLESRCRPTETGCLPRDPRASRLLVTGGVAAQLVFGSVVAVSHPYFDTRLKYDPDYLGKKDRFIAGRNAEAYLSAQWRFGEVFFGALDRNWGPAAAPSLLLSPSPYGFDHLGITIGTRRVRFDGVVTQLDDLADAGGTPNRRYFVAHRLVLRPGGSFALALWEGTVFAGPSRALEPWYANILNLGLLAQYDQGYPSNAQLGADVQTRVGRVGVFGQLLIDDIQIDRTLLSDREPSSYGVIMGAQGPAGPVSWSAVYTQVANLSYRTPNPAETVMRRNVGLARNFSDYDQITVRLGVLAGPGVLLAPEVTLVRQGEGDFRRPYPPEAAFPTTPTIFAGVVERTVRLALGARFDRGPFGVALDGGLHLLANADHVPDARETRLVGSVSVTYRFRKESELP